MLAPCNFLTRMLFNDSLVCALRFSGGAFGTMSTGSPLAGTQPCQGDVILRSLFPLGSSVDRYRADSASPVTHVGLEEYLEIVMFDLSWRDVTLTFHSVGWRKVNQTILAILPSTCHGLPS